MFRKSSPPVVANPTQGAAPSDLTNTPNIFPYLGIPQDHQLFVSDVPEDTALGSLIGDTQYPPTGPYASLIALRLQFPFLQIIPFPSRVISLALAANAAVDIPLPDGTVAIIIKGNGDYYVSNNGNAEIPAAPVNSVYSQSVFRPEGYLIYTASMRSLSLIAPTANTTVTILCFPLTALNPG